MVITNKIDVYQNENFIIISFCFDAVLKVDLISVT